MTTVADVKNHLELLHTEIGTTMGNVGVRTLADLNPNCVRPTNPPAAAPWPVGCWTGSGSAG